MATNWGLAANGGVASGTNGLGSGPGTDYDITWLNDGVTGASLYDGVGTHCYANGSVDTATITLAATKDIVRVVVWFSDNDARATDPGDSDTASSGYQALDFTIETWNGASWDTQATVTGNDKLKRAFDFASVSTDIVRINTTADGGGGTVLIQELEVFDAGVPTGMAVGSSTASAVGNPFTTTAAASGSSTVSAQGTSIGTGPLVCWNSQDKHASITLSDGGAKASGTGGSYAVRATKFRDRGKHYFEIDVTGSSASAGIAAASFPLNGVDYIGTAGSVGIRWSSGGDVEFSGAPHSDPSGQGFPQPLLYRFAVDFEAARMWIGDQSGWWGSGSSRNGDPATGLSPTFNDQAFIGHEAVAPAFASSAAGSASTGILRAAYPYLRYAPPAGFMPWDDYLDVGIAAGLAGGVAEISGLSGYGIAAVDGSSTAQGAGGVLVDMVGTAVGVGTATASEGNPIAQASGIAIAQGHGNPAQSIASAAGESATYAAGLQARVGEGFAAGIAVPYVHSGMREINATSTATASHTGTSYFESGGASYLNDGFTLFTGGVLGSILASHLGDYDSDSALTATMTWASNQSLNGIELYSSAWCDERYIGSSPDGSETFPADVGGAVDIQIQYDTTGSGVWADVFPLITGNNLIRRTIIFPTWLTTKAIRVIATSDSNYIRLQELKVFTPIVQFFGEAVDVVVETSTLRAVHAATFDSTGSAADVLVGTRYARPNDGGHATATAIGIQICRSAGAASGRSSVSGRMLLEAVVEDSASATDSIALTHTLKLVSVGEMTTKASGNVTHAEESTGNAANTIDGENAVTQNEESTGEATDTVIGIRRVTVIEISGGVTQAASVSGGLVNMVLVSTGHAVSIAVQHSTQTETLVSTGNAEETLPAPFQGSFPIFWTNSMSTGAATWNGLPFNSFIEADGIVYAAGPSGVFELGDSMGDLNADVPSEIEWDLVDNGSVQMKRMRSVYVNARTESPFTVRVANEQGVFEYLTWAADSETVTNHRAPVGRGIVSRNARLSLLHTKHFVAEDAGVGILESKRRI